LLHEVLGFEFRPELGRDPGLHRSIVSENLLFATGTYDQRRGNIGL
jgi:hypothetical protein